MSLLELFVDNIDDQLHAGVIHQNKLIDLYTDAAHTYPIYNSIYLGKVIKCDTKLKSFFIDLGDNTTGLLSEKDLPLDKKNIKGGDTLIVQIKSEAKNTSVHEDQKLPRLTGKIKIVGNFISYMPHEDLWIEEHISQDKREVAHEQEQLKNRWQKISENKEDNTGILHTGPNALSRALLDYNIKSFEHVYVGNRDILDLMINWCRIHFPSFAKSKRLRLFKPEKTGDTLFDMRDIYSELENLESAHISLTGAGSIIIENTTAMTLIDVNQTSGAQISEINKSAAEEIARQIKLRNLSGAILVDFINMKQKNKRLELQKTLEKELSSDPRAPQIHGFTRLGIMEITRPRLSASFHEKKK